MSALSQVNSELPRAPKALEKGEAAAMRSFLLTAPGLWLVRLLREIKEAAEQDLVRHDFIDLAEVRGRQSAARTVAAIEQTLFEEIDRHE